jgi:hypothetical protein
MTRVLIGLAAALMLCSCGPAGDQGATATPPADAPKPKVVAPTPRPPPEAPLVDSWVGHWNGPEGLFLEIRERDAASGLYAMTLKDNLDTQQDYQAEAADGGLRFTRRGQAITIHAGKGAATGFTDLMSKTDCLIVVPGKEGYCRG